MLIVLLLTLVALKLNAESVFINPLNALKLTADNTLNEDVPAVAVLVHTCKPPLYKVPPQIKPVVETTLP